MAVTSHSQLWLLVVMLSCFGWCRCETENVRTCEPIKLDLCRGIGYGQTSMPNLVGHDLQKDAQLQLQTFTPLIQYGCSSQLQFFLCSVYVPMCTEKVHVPIGPCRPLCETVRSRCQPVLQEFGFPWPSALNCSKFPPENNQNHMCMDGPGEESVPFPAAVPASPSGTLRGIPQQSGTSLFGGRGKNKSGSGTLGLSSGMAVGKSGLIGTISQPSLGTAPATGTSVGLCDRYRHADRFVYINRTGRCAQLCSANVTFSGEEKDFAGVWMAVWAALCFAATLFTAATFLIDASRFRYPERPIIFLAFCYNIYSVGFGVRLIAGRGDVACVKDPQHGVDILIQEGLDHTNCAIVFLLLYFFGMAASLWWLLLTVTWYMSAGRGWSHEMIQRWSSFLHLTSWGLPAAQTIAILVLMAVDADELTGMCYVGNQNSNFLLGFVIVPQTIYLLIGLCFMAAGFGALCQYRHHEVVLPPVVLPQHHLILQQQQFQVGRPMSSTNSHHSTSARGSKKGNLMIRIGIFSSLYLVPNICVLASHWYEYISRDSWLMKGTSISSASRPNMEVFMLRIVMSFVTGVACCFWIWGTKTANTWKKLGRRLLHRKQSTAPFLQPVLLKQQHVLLLDSKHNKRIKNGSKSGSETAV